MPRGRLLAPACLVATLALAPAAHAGSAFFFVPPLRIDAGSAMSGLYGGPGTQIVAGVHWASLNPNPTRFDVGVGMVAVSFGDAPTTDAPAMSTARAASGAGDTLDLVGGYAEVAVRDGGNRWWRGWLGGRVELGEADRNGVASDYVGVATRCTVELFSGGAGAGDRAMVLGTGALGVYAEVSARHLSHVGVDVGASVGVSLRVPMIFGS